MVGAAIHTRLAVENKPGAVMRSARAVLHVVQRRDPDHAVLSQSDRHPHRDDRQSDAGAKSRLCPRCSCRAATCPIPLRRRRWHFKQSIEYSLTNNYADPRRRLEAEGEFPLQHVQDWEERDRGGSRDTWTIYPKRIDAAKAEIESAASGRGARRGAPVAMYNACSGTPRCAIRAVSCCRRTSRTF